MKHERRLWIQGITMCCMLLQYVTVCCSVLQYIAVCCSVLQCVAVCCSVLQCVAVCCSVLHSHPDPIVSRMRTRMRNEHVPMWNEYVTNEEWIRHEWELNTPRMRNESSVSRTTCDVSRTMCHAVKWDVEWLDHHMSRPMCHELRVMCHELCVMKYVSCVMNYYSVLWIIYESISTCRDQCVTNYTEFVQDSWIYHIWQWQAQKEGPLPI